MFTFTGPFLAWGLVRFKLLDIVPVAKESVFSSMRDGAVILDALDRIVDFNPAALTVLPGLNPRLIGLDVSEFLLDRPEILEMLCPEGRPEADFQIGEGGSRLCYRASLSPIHNRRRDPMGRILLFRDTTEQVRLTEELKALAKIDDLTGTLNRRAFVEEGKKEILRAKRYAYPLSLMIIDLDHFKRVNDTWGHEVGDNVLKAACRSIRAVLRETDHFGRHGGEEFAVLLHKTPPDSACLVAERLRLAIFGNPVRLEGGDVVAITASVGVSGLDRVGNETLDDLIRAADRAMYKAKEDGRNCVRCL
jgi:diguanylate cyclase (GGDEF)-like protein